MTWTRLPDDFTDRPTVLGLSRSARLLHVEALIWCNRLLTDGVIPGAVLRRISDSDQPEQDVAELAAAGLWTRLEDGAWQVDWSDQEPAEKVQSRKLRHKERQQKYNERKERHANGDHSMCDPRYCHKAGNSSRDASPNASEDGLPTRPVPSRPEGEGQGQRGEGGSDSGHPARSAPRAPSAPPPTEPRWPGAVPACVGGPPPGTSVWVDHIEIKPDGTQVVHDELKPKDKP